MKKNIAVIFGGVSSEYDISLLSSSFIIENINKNKYNVIKLGITKEGEWYLYDGPTPAIADGSWVNDPNKVSAFISPDKQTRGIIAFFPDKTQIIPIDVIFPVLHGKNGEDGTIQGLFQMSGIPYVGCDTLSSAICMDKAFTHSLLNSANIEQTPYLWFYADRFIVDSEKIKTKITARFNYPVFVKPSKAGSSVGITKVYREEELDKAVHVASKEDIKIVVEQGIIGRELECAVMGGRDAMASPIGEISSGADFYDYDDKYKNGVSQSFIPANIDPIIAKEIQETAIHAYKYLGCAGLSRVDFFLTQDNKIILNEINTLPGFTSISMYPKLWTNAGFNAIDLIEELINTAFNRYE